MFSIAAPSSPSPNVLAPVSGGSRWFVGGLICYSALVLAAFLTGRVWLDGVAALLLITLLLSPRLRRGGVMAWSLWSICCGSVAFLIDRGLGQVALDFMPVFINAALCAVFARTLVHGRVPLIARLIEVLEGAERLGAPGIAPYARQLTWTWALLLGAQAIVLAIVVVCSVPNGLLADFNRNSPVELGGMWRWYLHFGSYAFVVAILVCEYLFRRWRLRHLTHPPLPVFFARLVRLWPSLVRSLADGAARAKQ